MKYSRIGRRAENMVALLSVVTACADLPADAAATEPDVAPAPQVDDAEADSRGVSASERGVQGFVPPSDTGELRGANIKIDSITATGDGCPSGTWTAQQVPEGSAFTLTLESYIVEAQATSTPAIVQLNCELVLEVSTPKDLSYAVTSFQFFGYARLAVGMKADLHAEHIISGTGIADNSAVFHYDLPVPYDTTYAVDDRIEARGAAPSWSECSASSTLTIRTRLTLENTSPDEPGVLTMDNIDGRGEGATKMNVSTRACPDR